MRFFHALCSSFLKLMPAIENKALRFLAWWKQGLANPLPTLTAPAMTVLVDNHVLCDSSGRALSATDIERCQKADGVHLIAPSQRVISKRVSDSQRGLPLSLIAQEVLPFDVSELFLACDEGQANIKAIVRSDLVAEQGVLKENGLNMVGVAFKDGDVLCFSNNRPDDQFTVDGARTASQRVSMIWPVLLVSLMLVPLVTFSYWSYKEARNVSALNKELSELQARLIPSQAQPASSPLKQVELRDGDSVASVLASFTWSLGANAAVSQLILSDTQLLVDASADSATGVQAGLDASGAFESSEFVTSISRSAGDDIERFRIKVNLRVSR